MKKIIVAPLNWGLGHATRCIPIIQALQQNGYTPIIASDGEALELLKQEFPALKSYQLSSYNIKYPKNGRYLKWKLLFNSFSTYKVVKEEHKIIEEIILKEKVSGIISDNRFGVRSEKVPSVYMTHQIKVLSGFTTFLTSWVHQKIIKKFDACWVPDNKNKPTLSGKLSHGIFKNINSKYVGIVARFKPVAIEKKYDVLILLSGLEPQRTLLEDKLVNELKKHSKKTLLVRGKIGIQQDLKIANKNCTVVNFLPQKELEKVIQQSKIVLCRSGYSTLLELASLNASVFFIPTPGQSEQEYLARFLHQQHIAPFATQQSFKLAMLKKITNYKGFQHQFQPIDFPVELFEIFN